MKTCIKTQPYVLNTGEGEILQWDAKFYAHFQEMEDLLLGQFDGLREQFDQHSDSQAIPAADAWKLTLSMFQHLPVGRTLHLAI